jgi:pimeloyl-ACP methyl ester carboxylesterase
MNWDLIYRGETRDLDDAVRAHAGGSFVRLSDGCTHYELGGPDSGEALVLVHGFSVPYFIWDPTFQALTAAGFRVLRYDLFGRGLSDRPRLNYDIELFVRQLGELVDDLALGTVSVAGLSMGGPIAGTFAARFPRRVSKLILVDPAGAKPISLSFLLNIARLPGMGEVLLGLFGSESLLNSIAADFFDPALVRMFQEKYRVQLQYRGFKRAILSSLREDMLGEFAGSYRRVAESDIPVLLVWGRNDRTVPFLHSRAMLNLIPGAEFHILENSSHIPHYEEPEAFNQLMIEFLKK